MSDLPAFRLVRRPVEALARVLDESQRAVVELRQGSGPVRVLGAAGTGKSTVLVESAAARVATDGLDPSAVLLLAGSRRAAAVLRDALTLRLGRTVAEPLARSVHSYAFGVLRRHAALVGDPPPRLLAAPEQDLVLRDLLAGHQEGEGRSVPWPETLAPALPTRGFRTELRDLFARAVERGIAPRDLADLGGIHGRRDWEAAAALFAEYLEVTALRSPGAYDPAGLVQAAATLLEDEPELLDEERRRWQLVLVDDYQDADPAVERLLALVAGGGRDLLVAGDPDSAVLGFRGGDPGLLRSFPERFRTVTGAPAIERTLRVSWRRPAALVEAGARVAARIPGPVGHRELRAVPATSAVTSPEPPAGPLRELGPAAGGVPLEGHQVVESHLLRSPTQEGAFVAHRLREARLRRRVPWARMAVVVRTTGQLSTLRRALTAAGVPVAVDAGELPVREQPAVVPLLEALRVVLDPDALDAETAAALLVSPLGGADAMAVRRLRQALRAEELGGGGGRGSDELLVEALADPLWVASLEPRTARPAVRLARILQAGREAARRRPDGSGFDDGVTAETVLWALWDASGLQETWRRTALAGGPAGHRADRDLDAVVALFDAAARFVDRLPAAGPAQFLETLLGQEVPGDTLADRAPGDDAVALLTAHSATGREWDLVVVAGVQEGVWPDVRPRGTLLGSERLVDLVTGRGSSPQATSAQVRVEETRLFHLAVSRARHELVVTAVRNDEDQPSPFLDLVHPGPDTDERPLTPVPRALALRAVVAELRQVVTAPEGAEPDRRRRAAASELARLARAGVRGAHPDEWYGVLPLSDDGPLRADGQPVTVSPSRVESFDRCSLRWLLESSGGTPVDSLGQSVGTLVHAVAAELPAGDVEELRAALECGWPALGLDDGWVGAKSHDRAVDMVRKLADYLGSTRRELVGVELDFEVQVGRARLTGRVDRLERDAGGRLVVIDLKTGKGKPSKDELARHAQLGAYQVAVEEGGFQVAAPDAVASAGAALVQLGDGTKTTKPQVQRPLAEDDDPRWAHELIGRVADGMAGAEFAATGNPMCRVCPVRRCCPIQPEGRTVLG